MATPAPTLIQKQLLENKSLQIFQYTNSKTSQQVIFLMKFFNIQNVHKKKVGTYNFKHFECLQLHCFGFFGVLSFTSTFVLDRALGDSSFLKKERERTFQSVERIELQIFERLSITFLNYLYQCMSILEIFQLSSIVSKLNA